MKQIPILIFGISVLCVYGCSSTPQKSSSASLDKRPEFTHSAVKQEIRKGETTQADLILLLGNPDVIYKNKDNNEVWTYNEQTYDAQSGALGGGIVLYGLTDFASPEAKAYDLIIEWSKGNIVRNFTVISNQL